MASIITFQHADQFLGNYQNGRGEMMALTKILIYYIDWSM